MKALIDYVLPISGLKNGTYVFDFQVDKSFFEHFESSLIEDGDLRVRVDFDKRPTMFVLDFSFEGSVKSVCDRCSDLFDMPIQGKQQFIIRFSEEQREDEDEIIFIRPTDTELDLAPMVYEVIHLGLPLRKTCPDNADGKPSCNSEIWQYFTEEAEITPSKDSTITNFDEDSGEDGDDDDRWSALKDLMN